MLDERLLRYIVRPSVAQERVTKTPEGLVRIALKKPWPSGTTAVESERLLILKTLLEFRNRA